ncbi:MAG: PAAR domain-containing protein [Methanosarcina sp.]|jgi:uncharacterized Zn-binding protein involved in type VI secretion
MAEPAAKKDDITISDSTSKASNVWVQPPGSNPPIAVVFSYEGNIDNMLSSNVFIMGKPAATVGSTATNSNPPDTQPAVTGQGRVITVFNNIATITTGSSTVYINGKKAARNGDKAKTWDYSTPPSPGTPKEIENAKVKTIGSVFIGG